MACRIQIKQNIINTVEDKTSGATTKTLEEAKVIAADVNNQFGTDVVSFNQTPELDIERVIDIPGELVDRYFEHEILLENEEAGKLPLPKLDIQLQNTNSRVSKANSETLVKVKAAMERMGVKFQLLHDYVKGNPDIDVKDVNGLADLSSGVIAVAQGYESAALTEEMVHIATAILEQTNPTLITALISKIERFKIYDITFKQYKGNKAYQLSNGKPDIRKIKKEAVDRLIAELIIHNSEGSTDFPELMQERDRTMVQKWWDAILESIRHLYGKSNIDLFSKTADYITNGYIGKVEDMKAQGVHYQLNNNVVGNNTLVDHYVDYIKDIDSRMDLKDEVVGGKKRHYTFDGEDVGKSVTELTSEKKRMPDRTDAQKISDKQKQAWGSAGHIYIQEYIEANLIDENGFKKPFTDTPIKTALDNDAQEKLDIFCRNLINSYPEGTRFLLEKMVVNRDYKGMLGSTIDFMAISPAKKPDGSEDIAVDILDWKFTDIDKSREEDIPWYKQGDWKPQMNEYATMMFKYGMKPEQLKKARMVPFIMNYDNIVEGDPKSGLRPTSIEIGKIDSLTETTLYLLPVPINSETTGNEAIDDLLKNLRSQWEKLYSKQVAPELRAIKRIHMNELSKAIRVLHVTLNFNPLVSVGRTFVNTSRATLDTFKGVDYTKLTKDQIEAKLQELVEFKATAINFTMLDEAFISQFGSENLSEEASKTLRGLKAVSANAKSKLGEILEIQREYVAQIAQRENFVNENNKTTLFDAEREIGGMIKNFVEGSRLPAKLINFASNLIMRVKKLADKKFIEKFDEFRKILLPLEQEAASRGKKAFDMIGTVDENGLHLIKKTKKEFWDQVREAKSAESENKEFLIKNMDMDKFNEMAKEAIDKGIAELNLIEFSDDKTADEYIRNGRIKRLRNSIDINREDFFGYDEYVFNHIFRQVVKAEDHLSDEYKAMAQSKAALDAWNFFTAMNEKARDIGYIDKQGMSFFPLIEASILDKFKQTSNKGTEFVDFFKELATVKSSEEQAFSKKDPTTGELKRTIPKYFTKKGNMAVEKLSTDLNKVGALWIKALMDFEAKDSIENTLLTIQAVERAKGSLVVDEQGDLVKEGGKFLVNKTVNKNADILDAILNDALYDLQEDLGSIGNIGIQNLAKKTTKTKEGGETRELSIKKGLKNADTLTRALAVGLKPLIGAANWAGYLFHAFIKGGDMYTFSEFTKNHALVFMPNMSIEDKALFHYLTTPGDDVMKEHRREAAMKKGLISYLSTWSFTDVMMLTNSFPERKLALTNAKSFNDNAIIVDGKIVNARQYLKKQDRENKYKLSVEERKTLEKSFNTRVKDLIASSTTLKSAVKITDEKITIEGVSEDEIVKYSLKVSEFARGLNGSMNDDNKAAYRRDTIFSSFMMFKNWIPKLLLSRTGAIKYNVETEDWEYGRMRAMAKTLVQMGTLNIFRVTKIINGSEEGLEILRTMLEKKKIEHRERTGQELEITEEEFFDMMRRELANEMKELGTLLATFGLVATVGFMKPPEEASDIEKNRWKLWAKMFNKMNEELSFYYLPTSLESVTKGSILPSLGLMSKVSTALYAFGKEAYGQTTGDDELVDKSYPLKYFFNLIPGLAQFQTDYLPYIDAELAKALGIRVTEQARRQ